MSQPPAADPAAPEAKGGLSARGRDALIGRLVVGHLAAYPATFMAALAGMSLSIIAQKQALLSVAEQLEPANGVQRWLIDRVGLAVVEAASFEIIMRPITWLLLLILFVSHALSIPWALAGRRAALEPGSHDEALKRAQRRWLGATVGLSAVIVVVGVGGWAWILLS